MIEAYARMQHVLAERELGRRTPEAPREYLRRVMRQEGMPEESLTALTALFEEARFSRHPIPDSAPRRAAPRPRSRPRVRHSPLRPMQVLLPDGAESAATNAPRAGGRRGRCGPASFAEGKVDGGFHRLTGPARRGDEISAEASHATAACSAQSR